MTVPNFLPYLEANKGNLTVYAHGDADGLTSAALLASAYDIKQINFPEVFGNVPITPVIPGLIVLDMVPVDPKLQGVVVDHHPRHPEKEGRGYELINMGVPTCLAMYHLLGDKIPSQHRWKLVSGLMGEGQPELTPSEICENFPILFQGYEYVSEKYGSMSTFTVPIFSMMSSGINNISRLGLSMEAYKTLKDAKSPIDLLENDRVQIAKENIKRETEKILKTSHPLNYGKFRLWIIESDYKMESLMASKIVGRSNLTTIVVNKKSGKMSCRGILTSWLHTKLAQYGYQLDGHAGYMGGTVKAPMEKLIEDLRHIA